jgi:hypothetical protein
MHPNLILASLVGEIEVFCIYKPYGCPAQLTLNSLQFHEQVSSVFIGICPSSSNLSQSTLMNV